MPARIAGVLIAWIVGFILLARIATIANGAPFLVGMALLFWGGCSALAWAARVRR